MNPLAILGLIFIVACLLAAAFPLRKTPVRAPVVLPIASPVVPPPARSDLSCFVRGLLVDLQGNPDGWTYNWSPYDKGHLYCRYGVTLQLECSWCFPRDKIPPKVNLIEPTHVLTDVERASLLAAVLKIHDDRAAIENAKAEKVSKDRQIKEAKREAETRARFERLGCPDGS